MIATAGLKDGAVSVFDMRSHKAVMTHKAHGGAINLLHITNDGLLLTGSADGSVKLFDIGNPNPVAQEKVTHAVICGQVVGNMVLTGNGDGNI